MNLLKLFILTIGLFVTTLSMAGITVQADPGAGLDKLVSKDPKVTQVRGELTMITFTIPDAFVQRSYQSWGVKNFTHNLNAAPLTMVPDTPSSVVKFPALFILKFTLNRDGLNTGTNLYYCVTSIRFDTEAELLNAKYALEITNTGLTTGPGCKLIPKN